MNKNNQKRIEKACEKDVQPINKFDDHKTTIEARRSNKNHIKMFTTMNREDHSKQHRMS